MNKLVDFVLIIDAHNHTHTCLFNQSNAWAITNFTIIFLNFTNFITKIYYNTVTIQTHVKKPSLFPNY